MTLEYHDYNRMNWENTPSAWAANPIKLDSNLVLVLQCLFTGINHRTAMQCVVLWDLPGNKGYRGKVTIVRNGIFCILCC